MKERELKAVADRRDMLSKDLEEARVEQENMMREIVSAKKQEESDDSFDIVDVVPRRDLHKRLSFLDVRKRNLLHDLNALVDQQQLKEPKQYDNQAMLEDEIKSKEKRIGILEQTIAQLQS